MKDLVKKAQSFITFDVPLEYASIKTLFAAIHHQQQSKIPEWSVDSTRQKLIAYYWYSQVAGHFSLLLAVPVLIVLLSSGEIASGHLVVILVVAVLAFGTLLFFNYKPAFSRDFLPKLETVASAYEKDQQAERIAQLKAKNAQLQGRIRRLKREMALLAQKQLKALEKCKQAQLSTLALTLIYKTLTELAGNQDLRCDNATAHLLQQLLGLDPRGIRKYLALIDGSGNTRNNLKGRMRTETINSFDEAYQFLEVAGISKGIPILKALEAEILGI